MTSEGPRRRELAQLVSYHILSHKDLNMGFPVVNHEGSSYELRHDGAATSPCLDRLGLATTMLALELFVQPGVHIRTFLE